MNNIEKEVIEIVRKAINGSENIDLDSSNKNIKKWDSLAHIKIVMMIFFINKFWFFKVIYCLTSKIGFAPHGEALMLKLRARCVEKKVFSRVSFIMKFFNVACAAVFVKFTRKRSLITFLYAYPFYMIGKFLEIMEEN